MRKSVLFSAAAVVVSMAWLPSEARAQGPLGDKLIVSANLGIQVGDNDLARSTSFDLYDEPATIDFAQTINNGFFFEFGGAYKVRPNFGVGLTYGFLSNSGPGTISGSLPHPLFFGRPRTFSTDVDSLQHSEQSLHFQAIYFMPFTDKVDFAFSGGPSLFNVKQELLQGVEFTDVPPSFDSVTIDAVQSAEIKDSGWGFNLGAEMTYAVTTSIGANVLLRYTHGNVEFNPAEGQTADVSAGGFQIGAGLKFRF
jgi:opacity protein-like surface antigen